jgi:hypothetical protein
MMLQILPDMPMAAKFVVAFVIVLVLIGLTAWLVRRFGANRLGSSARGRQPRLAIIDAASVDGRRRLVLIRRDNVEHLMMIGGPNDLIIEPNIVRAAAARDAGRETLRATTPEARPLPVGDGNGNWATLQPAAEPPLPSLPQLQQPLPQMPPPPSVQTPSPRTYRTPVTDEPWVPPEPSGREPALRARPADSLTGMASDFAAKLNPEIEPAANRPAVAREPAPPPATPPVSAPQTDRNLAEMAQRLEAALRRPTSNEPHPPVTDPLAASMPPAKHPEPPRTAKPDSKPEFKPEPKVEVKGAQSKNPFDSLEEEMANLLGRQSGKT